MNKQQLENILRLIDAIEQEMALDRAGDYKIRQNLNDLRATAISELKSQIWLEYAKDKPWKET